MTRYHSFHERLVDLVAQPEPPVRAAEPIVLADILGQSARPLDEPVPFARVESRMTRDQQVDRIRSYGTPDETIRDAAFILMRWTDEALGIRSRYTQETREWRS